MTPSKEKLSQNICDYIAEPILILDEKGDIQYANQFAEQFFELSLDKLIGKRVFNFIDSEDVSKIKKGLKFLPKNSESSMSLLFNIQLLSGRKIHVEATIRNLLNDATINGFLVIMRDISAKKKIENELIRTQNELKKSVEQMEFITDNTLDVIFQVKLTGEYTFMNSASKIIAGYDPKDMIGTKWMEYVPKKELPRYLSKVKELLSGKKITDFETFVIHKAGHLVPVEFSGNVVKEDKKIYINGVMRDLSKRIDSKKHLEDIAKKLEQQVEDRKNELEDLHEKLLESEAKYRALFMNLPDGAGVTDEHGDTIIDINAKLASSFHKTPDELIGKSWKDLLPEKIFNERYIYGRRALETNTVQCHYDQRAGMHFQTFYVPITLPNGEKIAYFVARDITTLKQQEEHF